MDKPSHFQQLIIIGAGRSGTNMLRDILVQFAGLGTWPCDEINYIWRHGNRSFPTDAFTPKMATPKVKRYIRRQFAKLATSQALETIVEKTCANSLRVGFVEEVLPKAKYIHIIRNGLDAAVSASERWTATLDLKYIFSKAKYVPPSDLPYYAGRYLLNRIQKLLSRKAQLAAWGPRFEGMEEVLCTNLLPVACAIQWQRCVTAAERELAQIPDHRVFHVQYEQFVAEPAKRLGEVLTWLDIKAEKSHIAEFTRNVFAGSVGRWQKKIDAETADAMIAQIRSTLKQFGYNIPLMSQ